MKTLESTFDKLEIALAKFDRWRSARLPIYRRILRRLKGVGGVKE